jgi:hypothetical protein
VACSRIAVARFRPILKFATMERLLAMADTRLTLMDLPSAARPAHKQELMALAQAEFGPRTLIGIPRKLLKAVFHIIALVAAAMLFRLIK